MVCTVYELASNCCGHTSLGRYNGLIRQHKVNILFQYDIIFGFRATFTYDLLTVVLYVLFENKHSKLGKQDNRKWNRITVSTKFPSFLSRS